MIVDYCNYNNNNDNCNNHYYCYVIIIWLYYIIYILYKNVFSFGVALSLSLCIYIYIHSFLFPINKIAIINPCREQFGTRFHGCISKAVYLLISQVLGFPGMQHEHESWLVKNWSSFGLCSFSFMLGWMTAGWMTDGIEKNMCLILYDCIYIFIPSGKLT